MQTSKVTEATRVVVRHVLWLPMGQGGTKRALVCHQRQGEWSSVTPSRPKGLISREEGDSQGGVKQGRQQGQEKPGEIERSV